MATSHSETAAAKSPTGTNVAALLCGIWFLLTGWMWGYLANLVIAYPFAVAGYFWWRRGRRLAPENTLNRVAGGLLLAGLVVSIGAIFIFK